MRDCKYRRNALVNIGAIPSQTDVLLLSITNIEFSNNSSENSCVWKLTEPKQIYVYGIDHV